MWLDQMIPFVGWLLSLSTSSSPIPASLRSDCSFQMPLMCMFGIHIFLEQPYYCCPRKSKRSCHLVVRVFLISPNHFTHSVKSYLCLMAALATLLLYLWWHTYSFLFSLNNTTGVTYNNFEDIKCVNIDTSI